MTAKVDLFSSKKNFFVLAHRARNDGVFNINDLCGSAGRLDGLMRCINSSLFLSHDMRRDSAIHCVLMGPSDPPKILSIMGSSVRYLNPDERSTASLVKKALEIPLSSETGVAFGSTPGIYVTRGGLEYVLQKVHGISFLLMENASDERKPFEKYFMDHFTGSVNFFLSDDRDFEEHEIELLSDNVKARMSISPKVLHTDHCITILHNIMDRMESKKF